MKSGNLYHSTLESGNYHTSYNVQVLEELQIDEFIWWTMHDSRVRLDHKRRHKLRFDLLGNCLSDPSISQKLPQEDPGCRCKFKISDDVIRKAVNKI